MDEFGLIIFYVYLKLNLLLLSLSGWSWFTLITLITWHHRWLLKRRVIFRISTRVSSASLRCLVIAVLGKRHGTRFEYRTQFLLLFTHVLNCFRVLLSRSSDCRSGTHAGPAQGRCEPARASPFEESRVFPVGSYDEVIQIYFFLAVNNTKVQFAGNSQHTNYGNRFRTIDTVICENGDRCVFFIKYQLVY